MPTRIRIPTAILSRVTRAAGIAAILGVTACESPEDRIAGRYVRTWKPGVAPEMGLDGQPESHILILARDRSWRSEHPELSLQQFDVPPGRGTYRVDGVTLTIVPTDLGPMQYTVSGDTLFPRTPDRARMSEQVTGFSMKIGTDTYLLRQR
jgi:hypothetical protein